MKHFIPFLLLTGLSAGIAFSAPPKKSAMTWPPSSKPNHVSVDKFTVDPTLKVTMWAKSPMLYNPTNMDIENANDSATPRIAAWAVASPK